MFRQMIHLKLALVCLLFCPRLIWAQEEPVAPKILIIHSYNEHIPWNKGFDDGLDEWRLTATQPFDIFREYLDVYRIPIEGRDSFWLESLITKYRKVGIDAIVGESEVAASFVKQHGSTIAPGAVQVFFTSHQMPLSDSQWAIVPNFESIVANTVKYAFQQNSMATRALVIDGEHEESVVEVAKTIEELAKFPSIKTEVLRDFSIADLIDKAGSIPADGLIFYSLVFSDRTGKRFIPKDILERLVQVSEAPVYVNYSSLLGAGAVGGHVLDGKTVAVNVLESIRSYISTSQFLEKRKTASVPMFDWQALQAHSIEEENLPPNSVIINLPLTFMERYYNQIIYGLIGFIVLYIAVISLAAYLSRKNRKLRKLNQYLTITKTKLNAANQVLSEIATIDPLTHLLNRRAMTPIINEAAHRSSRSEEYFYLILCDVVDFKSINDKYGHQIGDQVLIELSYLLEQTIRACDTVSRWGGEEFLILISVKSCDDSYLLAEKIRQAIFNHVFTESKLKVTISVGVTALKSTQSFEQTFCCVDRALYDAKKRGKNLVRTVN